MSTDTHSPNSATTHFGNEEVPVAEKAQRVGAVFRSVAEQYDMMNDIMSLGSHRLIKRFALQLAALRRGQTVLDLAGGSGDMSALMASEVGSEGMVVLADINAEMLQQGRDRLINRGLTVRGIVSGTVSGNVDDVGDVGKTRDDNAPLHVIQADGEQLPFPDNSFDRVCIAYGLRNFTDKAAALAAITAVLKPGGRVVILEFSKPQHSLVETVFSGWSSLWPTAGRLVAGDSDSYRYLVESIRHHPDQETLLQMMADAGLQDCRCHNVMGGINAIHIGFKP